MSREVMQMVLNNLERFGRGEGNGIPLTVLIHDLREALAQVAADQEGFYGLPQPSASSSNAGGSCVTAGETATQRQPEQEPYGYFKPEPFGWTDCAETDEGAKALYEAPPAAQRTWEGLTDEDMDFLFPHGSSVWVQETVKIIEAKLKEKNT